MQAGNFFQNFPASPLKEEFLETLVSSPNVRIERILSENHTTPEGDWYDQDEHEWVIVLEGTATLRFEDREVHMQPGDWIHIPSHTRHRVEQTSPGQRTLWLAVFFR